MSETQSSAAKTTDEHTRRMQALDRVGRYLADCVHAEDHGGDVRFCANHPITVGDLWTLYCARKRDA